MTNKFEKEVQGVALYLELRKPNATCQILVTPDGFGTVEGVVPAQFFRRVISSGVTKRRWLPYGIKISQEQLDLIASGAVNYDQDQTTETTINRFRQLSNYLESVASQGYKLVNDTPIYVEVTKEDLSAIKTGSMPNKLWTRVKSSRTALGFPDTIVDEPTTVYS